MSETDDLNDVEKLDLLRLNSRELTRSLISTVKSRNKKLKRLEKWREHQITAFLRILAETITDLLVAHKKKRISTVAWLTRNLLELSVWIEYCTASESSSLSFYKDSLKDAYGVARSLEQLDVLKYTHLKDDLVQAAGRLFGPIEAQDQIEGINRDFKRFAAGFSDSEAFLSDEVLAQMAAFIGEQSIRDNHLNVSEVARSVGRGDLFSKQNKFLSKFAHPTAFLTHMPPFENRPLGFFLEDAVVLASQCFFSLSAFVDRTFPNDETPPT